MFGSNISILAKKQAIRASLERCLSRISYTQLNETRAQFGSLRLTAFPLLLPGTPMMDVTRECELQIRPCENTHNVVSTELSEEYCISIAWLSYAVDDPDSHFNYLAE